MGEGDGERASQRQRDRGNYAGQKGKLQGLERLFALWRLMDICRHMQIGLVSSSLKTTLEIKIRKMAFPCCWIVQDV